MSGAQRGGGGLVPSDAHQTSGTRFPIPDNQLIFIVEVHEPDPDVVPARPDEICLWDIIFRHYPGVF